MMKTTHNILPTRLTLACLLTALAGTVFAQNTLISGDINVGTNWDDTVLPTNPLDPGIIDATNTGATRGTITTSGAVSGLAIHQTGGELNFTAFGTSLFDDVDYEISGGTFTSTSFGHRSQNNSVFDVSGGTVNVVGFGLESSSTLNLTSGSINATGNLTTKASTWNISGGSLSVGGGAISSFNNGTFNFSGDATFDVTGQMGFVHFGTSSAINVGAGTGSISVGTLEADSMTIDWASGTGYSWTASSILNNGVAATWEDLWNAGQLTLDGGNTGTFSENFQVSGSTLTVIPEPSSIALLGLAGVALAILRRRRN